VVPFYRKEIHNREEAEIVGGWGLPKSLLVAALIVGAVATTAFAKDGKPVRYYLATADGGAHCDGLWSP
jgi:hypothetical protein